MQTSRKSGTVSGQLEAVSGCIGAVSEFDLCIGVVSAVYRPHIPCIRGVSGSHLDSWRPPCRLIRHLPEVLCSLHSFLSLQACPAAIGTAPPLPLAAAPLGFSPSPALPTAPVIAPLLYPLPSSLPQQPILFRSSLPSVWRLATAAASLPPK